MTQIYTRLFSQKYIDTKSLHFSLLHIDGLHHKKHLLHNWRDSIRSGKITKANQAILTQTDKEIDRMVYALYGLTPEEIAIVEGG